MRAGNNEVRLREDVCVESPFLVQTHDGRMVEARSNAAKGGTLAGKALRAANLGNAVGCQERDGQLKALDVLGAL